MSDTTTTSAPDAGWTETPKPAKPAPPTETAKSSGTPWLPIFLAAMAFALLYAGVAVVTYLRADDQGMDETVWSRLIFVLHGLEAIAFTAVGWIFGREVHRTEAKHAKEEANDAKAQAAEMKDEAHQARQESAVARVDERAQAERAATAETKGWRLAEAVRAKSEPTPTRTRTRDIDGLGADEDGGNERSPAGGHRTQAAGRDHVRDLADSLFPPS